MVLQQMLRGMHVPTHPGSWLAALQGTAVLTHLQGNAFTIRNFTNVKVRTLPGLYSANAYWAQCKPVCWNQCHIGQPVAAHHVHHGARLLHLYYTLSC
jgi:hypothetical protein